MFADQTFSPYIILLCLVCLIFILLYARRIVQTPQEVDEILIGNGQTIGKREEQDDYFSTVISEGHTLAVVADGISGLANGRMASTLAVTTFVREFMKLDRFIKLHDFFSRAAHQSNQEILKSLSGASGGTTLACAAISHNYLHWGAVGDSIIALYRNGHLVNVNEKHTLGSLLEEQYLSGQITKQQAMENPQRKRLINYLGFEGFKSMEIGEPLSLKKGDKIVLCTDGVYNSLTELELCEILEKPMLPIEAAEEIINRIDGKGLKHQDNATIIILEKSW
ncbi:PP2C family protein-serine/threonine phosphatase [Ferdinandcohnia quinoae]|uniref:Protein phosphatase 2C domain-containing protein n=1 Tax=Fredinandcohnia quinoae TaxID=2918902 RepID=A0AAW5DZB9_9BACI|nr:protein phosphatase 2C domain-containing protein [Fredinandcohnia sp. SECRCQ15]MCH1625995.1 protein phosphatase 2C domain-containing protein [Fredinandcohnia sp. SECRCQ15]